MNLFFDVCLNKDRPMEEYGGIVDLSAISPEPIKFRVAKTLNLLDPILKNFALPRRK